MQPTETQVQRSLAALRTDRRVEGEPAVGHTIDDVPPSVRERVDGSPAIRPERLAEVRLRLESGVETSAEDLAQRMVGRLVCDRLR